ncbi:hypothetical protein [Nonomuraea sp. NPDC002799]
MDWWKLGLEYFKVAVGWPVIVLAIAITLRKPIATIFNRELEAEAAGVKLRVGRAKEAAEDALEEATEVSEKAEGQVRFDVSQESEQVDETELSGRLGELESQLIDEEARRASLERVLSEGARLGWEWARSGESEPPELAVYWNAEGQPKIVTREQVDKNRAGGQTEVRGFAYEQRVLGLLMSAFPGCAFDVYPDSGPDLQIRSQGTVISVVIKHVGSGRYLSTVALNRAMGRIAYGVTPVLLVTNVELSKNAKQIFQDMNSEAFANLSWVTWSGDSDNGRLIAAANEMIEHESQRS